ncbi:MAG: endonuclease domain-containing protein [Bacteroidota bacterium]
MTDTEQILWKKLKGKKMLGLRFRPQHPIDIFIADFYCHLLKLVIEIDGGIHKSIGQKEYDIGREVELENWGIKVIRFTSEEIENEMSRVLEDIKQFCLKRKSELPQSPLQGI